ncbi:helix-turn-helix domain-containing protein [Enterococcus sp. HY326]|uniref:helix-turn-helix domain-containing protein n=1 Tax=Enterococcus sp. HY326 TaxID=2971265 RepID=UPI00223F78E7|nr:helix-turn-helix transcriptional regulator [Enterococcus sp. HY326]
MSDKQNNIAIGTRIKSIRISQGLTMEDFGKKFTPKATKGTVSNWENGNYLPNNERLKRIAEIGNVSMVYLLEGKYMLKDIHMMPKEEQEKLAQSRGSAFGTDSENEYFLQMAKKFCDSVDDDHIKKDLALLLNGLIEIKEGLIPKKQLKNELSNLSSELSKIPFRISELK